MKRIVKHPKGTNRFSGRVCLSPEEFELAEVGVTKIVVLAHRDAEFPMYTKVLEQWMLDASKECDGYYLVPITAKHKIIHYRKIGKLKE